MAPDGLSAEQLRKSLQSIPSTLQGMRSPLGEHVRSESVAGMDMLNDMFQRQARRLESQLYQRAQDQRTIEATQRQVQIARAQVTQLENHQMEQAARISQGNKSLQHMQSLIRESLLSSHAAITVCDALERDVSVLRELLQREAPTELEKVKMLCDGYRPSETLRVKARALESALAETDRSSLDQIGSTPLQSVAMSDDSNPLNHLSAVADYATKASVAGSSGGMQGVMSGGAQWSDYAMPTASSAPAAAPAPLGSRVLPNYHEQASTHGSGPPRHHPYAPPHYNLTGQQMVQPQQHQYVMRAHES